MKASDLRIGNYILDYEVDPNKTIYYQIEGINKGGVFYRKGSCWSCFTSLEPIPLTEEILLKCGFVRNKLKANHNVFVWYENHIGIKGMLGVVKPTECKHLHQLQNLYFALTNEELKIEL